VEKIEIKETTHVIFILHRYKPAIKYCALPSGILSSGSPLPARYVLIFAPFELSCIEGNGGTYDIMARILQ